MKDNNAKGLIDEIVIRGHLDSGRADWFDGMALRRQADGTTALSGRVVDQAALHGLLSRIRDMGLVLLSLRSMEPDELEHQ